MKMLFEVVVRGWAWGSGHWDRGLSYNAHGQAVLRVGFEPVVSVAAPASCPVALRARMRPCRLPAGPGLREPGGSLPLVAWTPRPRRWRRWAPCRRSFGIPEPHVAKVIAVRVPATPGSCSPAPRRLIPRDEATMKAEGRRPRGGHSSPNRPPPARGYRAGDGRNAGLSPRCWRTGRSGPWSRSALPSRRTGQTCCRSWSGPRSPR